MNKILYEYNFINYSVVINVDIFILSKCDLRVSDGTF